ncbi:MAG: A24 family peptidase [Alphaproteobacteria bacterium]|nr:A24 family peptidase [Alphaproteobacteria bacterium]
MHHHNHHIIANLLHLLAGGGLGLIGASLAMAFGWRSADRLPGESRRPQCVYCSRPHTWQELSPLIGWLLRPDTLSFPCPCGQRTGVWQQPVCELVGFALGGLAMYLQDWSWAALPLCLGIGLLPAIALIDFYFGIIPDGLNFLLGVFGFLFVLFRGDDFFFGLVASGALLALGLFFAIVYSKWRGREMLGLGDVKLFAAAGMWLHLHTAPWFLALGGFIGVLFNLIWRRISDDKQFPFAPALCLSLALCVFYQLIGSP